MTRAIKIMAYHGSLFIVAGLGLLLAPDVAGAGPAPAAAITIGNFTFRASAITIRPGTTVTWTNGDDIPHTVVSNDGLFRSKVLDTGDKFSFTFAKSGQFGYFCSLHPHMTGTIVVKA